MASPSSRTDPVKIRSTATTTLCELVSPTVSWKLASRCRSIPLSPPRAITETGRRWSGHVTHTCFVWLCHIRLFFGVWSCHTFVLGQAMSNVFVCVFWSGHVIYIYFLGPVTSPMFFCLVVSHVFWVGHVIHVFCLFGYVTFFGLVMWLFSLLFPPLVMSFHTHTHIHTPPYTRTNHTHTHTAATHTPIHTHIHTHIHSSPPPPPHTQTTHTHTNHTHPPIQHTHTHTQQPPPPHTHTQTTHTHIHTQQPHTPIHTHKPHICTHTPTVKVWKETQPGCKPKPAPGPPPPKSALSPSGSKASMGWMAPVSLDMCFGLTPVPISWASSSWEIHRRIWGGETVSLILPENLQCFFSFSFFFLLFQLMSCSWFYCNLQCFFSLLSSSFSADVVRPYTAESGGKNSALDFTAVCYAFIPFSFFLLLFQLMSLDHTLQNLGKNSALNFTIKSTMLFFFLSFFFFFSWCC